MRFYSYRSASTVFLVAVRQLCQLTVSNTTATATAPAAANTHQLSAVLQEKFCSHLCMTYRAMGQAGRHHKGI